MHGLEKWLDLGGILESHWMFVSICTYGAVLRIAVTHPCDYLYASLRYLPGHLFLCFKLRNLDSWGQPPQLSRILYGGMSGTLISEPEAILFGF